MIFVDRIRPCRPNPKWRWSESCHLYSLPGTVDQLHAFAARLGLKREWFETGSRMPHYDLTKGRRTEAVKCGAIEVDDKTMVEHMRAWRSWELAKAIVEWAEGESPIIPVFPVSTKVAPYHDAALKLFEKKYLVVPGYVRSRNDGDQHWISATDLMRLYCVRQGECVIDDGTPISSELRDSLTVLRPRYDGDYPIFRKSNPTQK